MKSYITGLPGGKSIPRWARDVKCWGLFAGELLMRDGVLSFKRLRIGCVFGLGDGIFCCVLHTQVLGVVESGRSRVRLAISRSSAGVNPGWGEPKKRSER